LGADRERERERARGGGRGGWGGEKENAEGKRRVLGKAMTRQRENDRYGRKTRER